MNLEISASDYTAEYTPASSSLLQPSVMIKKDPDHWRTSAPSSFGLANILNRSSSSASAPLPKFSLPSLSTFGKPLITRPDPSMHRSRSILSDTSAMSSSSDPTPNSLSQHALASEMRVPLRNTNEIGSPSDSMGKDTPPLKAMPSRRIAPAPIDDDDAEPEEGAGVGGDSIRGGRWSTDEHERFLAGFRIHGHKWKRVQQVVRTRSVTQVRTHAQKYLLKLAKLKAEKKQDGDDEPRGMMDSASDTDVSMTQSGMDDFDSRSPHKKPRRHGESLDEEYITAAASTLCFLMRQKIDLVVDSRQESDRDLEPYDCYSSQTSDPQASRKRPYMHFITDNSDEYTYGGDQHIATEASNCAIEGKQLCSS